MAETPAGAPAATRDVTRAPASDQRRQASAVLSEACNRHDRRLGGAARGAPDAQSAVPSCASKLAATVSNSTTAAVRSSTISRARTSGDGRSSRSSSDSSRKADEDLGVLELELIILGVQQPLPGVLRRHDLLWLELSCGALVGHVEEQQVGQLLGVLEDAGAGVAQHVTVGPELVDQPPSITHRHTFPVSHCARSGRRPLSPR